MDAEREAPRGREGGPGVAISQLIRLTVPLLVTSAMTDEQIDGIAKTAGDEATATIAEAMRQARRKAREVEAAMGLPGPYGFPNGLAAAAGPADDPTPIDPISARTRDHPRVRALYRKWFAGPGPAEEC